MFKNISKFINSHPIGQMFRLGEKTAAWKKVRELKPGMRIAVPNNRHPERSEGSRVSWDEIVSIKKVAAERVWDIEVEATHNFVGNGIVAHNTGGLLLRAGASSLQLSSSATSIAADIQLAAADRIDLFAGSLSLQTSSTTAGELKLMSKGSLILDTSGGTGDLIMTKLNTLGYVCTTAAGVVTAGGASCATSDVRLKTDIRDLSQDLNVLESLEKLRGVSFTWDETNPANAGAPTGRQVGMIAQEVEQVLPSLVAVGADGYRRLDYAKMTGYLVEVAKELNLKIDQLGAAKGSDPFVNGGGSDPALTLDGSNGTYESDASNAAADLDSLRARVTQLEDLVALLAGGSTLSTSASALTLDGSNGTYEAYVSNVQNDVNLGSGLVSPQPTPSFALWASAGKAGLTLSHSGLDPESIDIDSRFRGNDIVRWNDNDLQVLGSATVGGTLTVGLITIDDLEGSIYGMGCSIADARSLDSAPAFAKASAGKRDDGDCTALKIQPLALGNVEFLGGKIVMTKTGDMEILGNLGILGDLEVGEDLEVGGDVVVGGTVAGTKIEILEQPENTATDSARPTTASIGEAVIPAGQTEAVIYSTAVTANSKVFVTADRPAELGAKVSGPGRFTIELGQPTPAALKVSWWVVN